MKRQDRSIFAGIVLFLGLSLAVSSGSAGPGNDVPGIWNFKGPSGGDITALAIDPTDSKVVFAATRNQIFRSTDGGKLWTGVAGFGGRTLLFNPLRRTTVYGRQGQSSDSGKTWESFPDPSGGAVMAVDPTNLDVLYAGGVQGIAKSTNGGTNWTLLDTPDVEIPDFPRPPMILPFEPHSIVVHPTEPSKIYAQGLLFIWSQDGGASWEELESPLNVPTGPLAPRARMVADPTGVLYLGGSNGLFRSENPAEGFEEILAENVRSLVLIPSDPVRLFVGTTQNGVMKSEDQGETWEEVGGEFPARPVNALAINPFQNRSMLAGTPVGVYQTDGERWTETSQGLGDIRTFDLAAAGDAGEFLYALTPAPGESQVLPQNSTLHRSSDGGVTWGTVELPSGSAGFPGGSSFLAVDPETPSRLYLAGGRGALRSVDGGQSWSELDLPKLIKDAVEVNPELIHVAVDPQNPNRIYAAGCRIYGSEDGGDHWTTLLETQTCLESRLFFQRLLIDTVDPSTIYGLASEMSASGFNFDLIVYRSTNSGISWTKLGGVMDGGTQAIAPDPHQAGQIWVITEPTEQQPGVSNGKGLYRSTDRGDSFELISDDLPSGTTSLLGNLRVDLLDPNTLYLYGGRGVFRSQDGGKTWEDFNDGFYPGALNPSGGFAGVYDLDVTAGMEMVLFAATQAGIFRHSGTPVEPIALVFPQFFNGGDPDGSPKPNSSRIILRSSSEENVQVRIRFRDSTGIPIEIPVRGVGEVSEFQRTLLPHTYTEVETTGEGDLKFGVVEVLVVEGEADKLSGTLVFSLFGKFVSLDASAISSEHGFFVVHDPDPVLGEDTGIAAYNPDPNETAEAEMILLNEQGMAMASRQGVRIGPNRQLIGFVTQEAFFADFFKTFEGVFRGSVQIRITAGPETAVLGLVQKRPPLDSALLAISNRVIRPPGMQATARVVFPQFIDGGNSGRSLQPNRSRLVILSRLEDAYTELVPTFRGPAGDPISVSLGGIEGIGAALIRPLGVADIRTDGTGDLKYGTLEAELTGLGSEGGEVLPADATGSLVFALNGTFVSVGGSEEASVQDLFVSVDPDPVLGENTGVAIYSQRNALVQLELLDEGSTILAVKSGISLNAGSQFLGFVTEQALFKEHFDAHPGPFRGTLRIRSTNGAVVLGLIQKTQTFDFALIAIPTTILQ